MSFAIGQRWISETENSLGLGMITALNFRSVTLHFPASDETRIYAVAQAPLTRIALNKENNFITKLVGKVKSSIFKK